MSKYTCELCLKSFKQNIDYTRHKNKKNACISIDQLKKLTERKITEEDAIKNMTTLFDYCMNVLRDCETLVGDKALKNLSYLIVLRLLEPMIGNEIDFNAFEYILSTSMKSHIDELLHLTRFSNIASSDAEDIPSMLNDVWKYILSQHPKTRDIFLPGKGFDIKKQSTFSKIVAKLYAFDFESVESDIQGHAYEDLLKCVMVGKVLGQYFTQPLVKDMMVELINPQVLDDGTIETIFDPAMGTGGFLMTSLKHIQGQAKIKGVGLDWDFIISQGLGGREAEPDTFTMAKTNMLISSGHIFNTLEQGDSIRDPIINKYDIILANPPFGIKGLDYTEIESQLRDVYMPIESKSAVPLFLQAIIYSLKVGGRCAVVIPSGQELFGTSKTLVALREYLMKTCELKEIIYLPSGVFTNTNIKTCVAFFYKRCEGCSVLTIGGKKVRTYKFSSTHQTRSVKFYDCNPYEKVKNLLVEADIDRIAENGYSLDYSKYMEKEEDEGCGYVEMKRLGEVSTSKNGKQLSRKDMVDGEFPVIGGGQYPSGYHNKSNCKENTILCASSGSAGYVSLYPTKVWASDCFAIFPNELVTNKYLYYCLKSLQGEIYKKQTGTAQQHVYFKNISSMRIPVPTLAVQEEMVEKLDFLYDKCVKTTILKIEELKTEKSMLVSVYTVGSDVKRLGEVCKTKAMVSLC